MAQTSNVVFRDGISQTTPQSPLPFLGYELNTGHGQINTPTPISTLKHMWLNFTCISDESFLAYVGFVVLDNLLCFVTLRGL